MSTVCMWRHFIVMVVVFGTKSLIVNAQHDEIVFYPLFTSGAITDMVAILGTKSLLHNMVK